MNTHHLFVALIISSVLPISISTLPRFFPSTSAIAPSPISNATAGAWDALKRFSGCHHGQRIDGLAEMKQYFYRFGYMNDNNFTDDFDHSLESAIRTYQHNFNLNATGDLDGPTMAQIVRPRCGIADIINGSSWMNSGKRTTSSNFHSVAHYTYFSGEPRWPEDKRDLTYAFFPGNQLQDSAKEVFSRAFARWAAVIPMTFTETQSFSGADIRIGFFSGDHGDGEAFDGVLGTLAHAFSPPSGNFHLDAQENWVVDGDITAASGSTAVDMESVAVHEIGHLLGMGHSSVEEAIMYPTISAGTRRVELAEDDVEGIQQLYGSNPNYNASTAEAARERDSSGSGSHFVGRSWRPTRVVLVVALVLLCIF